MDTTLNIRIDILEQIVKIAQAQDLTCSEMIVILVKKVMGDINDPGRIGKRVQYQKRCPAWEQRPVHVTLMPDDYEYFLDMRKLMKMSVSLILANAVKRFLSKHIQIRITDNYLYKNYIIIREVIDNIICWRFIWGYPPNINKLFQN